MRIGGVDLETLEYESIGSWPLGLRILAIIGIGLVVVVLGYWFDIQDIQNKMNAVETERIKLEEGYAKTHHLVINLEAYRKQVGEVRQLLAQLSQELPKTSEEAVLLDDISQQASLSGLRIKNFTPQQPAAKSFYSEEPIELELLGSYHNFGEFVSSLSKLSRIVTLHNFSIKENKEAPNMLDILLSIKTYWISDIPQTKEKQEGAKPGVQKPPLAKGGVGR